METSIQYTSSKETQERNGQISNHFFELIDKHLKDLIEGKSDEMMELSDFAKILFVSPKHLIKIVKSAKGEHPCHFYVEKILDKTKQLLTKTDWSIAHIANLLTYDPSNFTKFFKKYIGITPSQYRTETKAKSSP